jgi:hypothetical protein
MEDIQIRIRLRTSAQRAMLGAIYPEIRGIAVGFDGLKKLTIKMYLDRIPNEEDHEELSDISAGILGDIDFDSVEEICEYNNEKPIRLNGLDFFVYLRKEPRSNE